MGAEGCKECEVIRLRESEDGVQEFEEEGKCKTNY